MGNRVRKLKSQLRKGDQVVVIAGKDRGKKGKILQVMPKKSAVLVENANMVHRHTKQSREEEGGIIQVEAPIHVSNVMIVDPSTGNGTRVGKKVLGDGRKVRVARASGEVLDS